MNGYFEAIEESTKETDYVQKEFNKWWKDTVKDSQWTVLERMAALDAWKEQGKRFKIWNDGKEERINNMIFSVKKQTIKEVIDLCECYNSTNALMNALIKKVNNINKDQKLC